MKVYKGHVGIGNIVSGEALVASDNFSARYDLDRHKGIFSRPTHKLYLQSYVNKILVLNVAKGGVASAWMFRNMLEKNIFPKGLLLNRANPIIAQGAAHANLTLIDRFDVDITQVIKKGDFLTLNPHKGTVTINLTKQSNE
tara:strand:+ start:466 stop:888 length:423 start_codon:yes stop_codon:yes gene_type:complete